MFLAEALLKGVCISEDSGVVGYKFDYTTNCAIRGVTLGNIADYK